MTPLNALLIGIGGFSLGVVTMAAKEARRQRDVTVLVTDRDQLDRLDRIFGEEHD